MANGDSIYLVNGVAPTTYKGWKALDASSATSGDSGWLDPLPYSKFSLEVTGIAAGDKVKLWGTNKEFPLSSDAGQLIGAELTANGYTQFTGSYARLRVTQSANAGGGSVTAVLLATK